MQNNWHSPSPPVDNGYWPALQHYNDYLVASSAPLEAPEAADWDALEKAYRNDENISVTVVGYNRGGVLVEWRQIRGFVPGSQLIDFPAEGNLAMRRNSLADQVGKTLCLRVIELNRLQNRLILSERLAQANPGARHQLLNTLRRGSTIRGEVTNITEFGVFIDLGGIEGLIHISELSWGRVAHPADILQRGQSISTYVLDVVPQAGRIALSLKRLRPDPWQTLHERYALNTLVTGSITNITEFGAFMRVEDGLEGLIHLTELAEGTLSHPRDVVQEGQTVTARIVNLDARARRLGLSLRGMEQIHAKRL
jgi:small subunit ribosomal protein S1